jgi:gliding motility-associated-like protein
LQPDSTIIDVLVTAQDGTTTRLYSVKVKRALNYIMANRDVNPETRYVNADFADNTIKLSAITPLFVHQGLSPNGDGLNDYLVIEGLDQYPENEITIINSKGGLVYKTVEYGAKGNVFDGHANNGTMQVPGTYYYILEYKKGKTKERKTGYIILKY